MNILLPKNADTANHCMIYGNSKSKGFVFICGKHSRNKIFSILLGIRVRQTITKIILYFFI